MLGNKAGRLLMCASGSLLAGIVPAAAQTAAEDSVAAPATVEDIVVTAQRRETNNQDTPIAVTAVSAKTLTTMGVNDTSSLTLATPGLAFNRQAAFGAQIFLRGVGSASALVGQESPVAVYIDDVYIGMPDPVQFTFNNIAGVEVLKGPQGTLFGRNATGGVIHVHTREPSHTTSADMSVGHGNFDTWDGSFYGTTGVTDTLAVNVALVGHDQRDGYGHDLTTGDKTQLGRNFGARLGALWEPVEGTRIRLSGDYSIDKSDFGANFAVYPGAIGQFGTTFAGNWNTYTSPADTRRNEQYGGSAKVEQDIGDLKAKSITAWRKASSVLAFDQDGGAGKFVAIGSDSRYRSLSQEFQLASGDGGPLHWLAGLYYFHLVGDLAPQRISGAAVAPLAFSDTIGRQVVNSYAAFGELTYALAPRTNITVGARYTKDDYSVRARRVTSVGPSAGSDLSASESFPKLTYRAIVDHHFTKDVMAYLSYSRGFKSGGWTLSGIYTASPPTAPSFVLAAPVKPEVLDAFEFGVKSELFDHRLRVNASAFYYDYKNLQVSSINGIGVAITTNAAAAKIKGGELQVDFAATGRLSLSGTLSVLDGHYTSFPNGPATIPNPATCTPVPVTTGPITGGNRQCSADLSGNDTIRTPPVTANLTATYKLPTRVGDFQLSGTAYYNDGFYWEADNRLRQSSYTLLNTSLRWTDPSERWNVTLWAKNLTNEIYYLTVVEATLRDSSVAAAPRTYGITVGLHI